jgi:hypothetical protein
VGGRKLRWVWVLAAITVAGVAIAEVPSNLRDIDLDRDGLSRQAASETALARLVAPPAVRAVLASCSPISADWRIVPILAFDLHRDPAKLAVVDSGVPDHGAVIEATRGVAGAFFQDITHPLSSFERRHYRVLAANSDFTLYARC